MGGGGARVAVRDQWYTRRSLAEGSSQRPSVLVCKCCNQDLPWADPKNPARAKRYHWPHGPVCQGILAERHGNLNIVGLPVLHMFGENPHYGRVVYERTDLMRAGRRAAGTTWRVQFEDTEEYDLPWHEVSEGLTRYATHGPPRDEYGRAREIDIPLDHGLPGIPGQVFGEVEDSESDDDDDMPEVAFDDNEEEVEYDEAEYDEVRVDENLPDEFSEATRWYFEQTLTSTSPVNIFTHIIESLEQRKGATTNVSITEGFRLQQKNFGVKLPRTWDTLKRMLNVPDLDSTVRIICLNGCFAWRYLHKKSYESCDEEEACPRCGHPRFYRRSGKLTPHRVMWYLGLHDVIADFFKDPVWSELWKKDLDISIAGIRQSKHVARMHEFFNRRVLQPNSGLYEAFDDGFTMCTNGTNGITLFGIQSLDVPASISGKKMNRRPFLVVGPPEPKNTSLLLEEFVEDANTLCTEGITVQRHGQDMQYTAFLTGWMADAIARAKLLGIGGPGKMISCGNCWQHPSFLVGTTWYPAGYATPILRWTSEGGGHFLELYAGLPACCAPACLAKC